MRRWLFLTYAIYTQFFSIRRPRILHFYSSTIYLFLISPIMWICSFAIWSIFSILSLIYWNILKASSSWLGALIIENLLLLLLDFIEWWSKRCYSSLSLYVEEMVPDFLFGKITRENPWSALIFYLFPLSIDSILYVKSIISWTCFFLFDSCLFSYN